MPKNFSKLQPINSLRNLKVCILISVKYIHSDKYNVTFYSTFLTEHFSLFSSSHAAWFLLAEIYIQEKDWDTGLSYFRKLLDLHPQNETLMNSYAAYCFQAGKFMEAVEVFKRYSK